MVISDHCNAESIDFAEIHHQVGPTINSVLSNLNLSPSHSFWQEELTSSASPQSCFCTLSFIYSNSLVSFLPQRRKIKTRRKELQSFQFQLQELQNTRRNQRRPFTLPLILSHSGEWLPLLNHYNRQFLLQLVSARSKIHIQQFNKKVHVVFTKMSTRYLCPWAI